MKKTLLFLTMMLALIGTSCGGGEKSGQAGTAGDGSTLTVENSKINGQLGDFFEIVARDYTVNDGNVIEFEIKRIAEGFPGLTPEEVATIATSSSRVDMFEIEVTAELLDENGNLIDKERKTVKEEELLNLGVGETTFLKAKFNSKIDMSKVASVRFKSEFKVKDVQLEDVTSAAEEMINEVKEVTNDADEEFEKAAKGIEAFGNAAKALGDAAQEIDKLR